MSSATAFSSRRHGRSRCGSTRRLHRTECKDQRPFQVAGCSGHACFWQPRIHPTDQVSRRSGPDRDACMGDTKCVRYRICLHQLRPFRPRGGYHRYRHTLQALQSAFSPVLRQYREVSRHIIVRLIISHCLLLVFWNCSTPRVKLQLRWQIPVIGGAGGLCTP